MDSIACKGLPHIQAIRIKSADDVWDKDQKSVCALVLAIVNEAQTL